ncbi:MAG: class I SAM-dependent methyltransferase [Phycisphaerales bacterium]|nr:MAG: class I SAM-dependent methyltransferase [Phycisphaerales bacterium]
MCKSNSNPPWLDEQQPHDEQRSAAQIAALVEMLGPDTKRVLDLGCGAGRVLVPLAEAGHDVTGVDRNEEVLAICRQRLDECGRSARLLRDDFLEDWPALDGTFDAVCLLGNTIMTVAEIDDAVRLMQRIGTVLGEDGVLVIDDCPGDFWPELTEGNWTSGISEDGSAQLLWEEDDAVFALRFGDEVDAECWRFKPTDRLCRLWTFGALRLTTRLAGLSDPTRVADGGLLTARRATV